MKQTITLILMLILILSCSESNNRTELLQTENENLQTKVDSLYELITAYNENLKVENDSIAQSSNETETNYWFIPTYDGKKLIKSGISDPEDYIEASLREKPELIPLKAVLGGTMRFGTIQILSDKWLITDFNDGHIEGKAIYKYNLNTQGELEFQLLEMTNNSQ